jgi:hypothetical protein
MPRPHVTWYKDGAKLQSADLGVDYSSSTEDQAQLILEDVKMSDGGLYQCLVANIHGNISFTYHVTVIGMQFPLLFIYCDLEANARLLTLRPRKAF